MGKRLNVYLNNYYANMFNEIKEKLREKTGLEYNNTDIIRIALKLLYEEIKKEE